MLPHSCTSKLSNLDFSTLKKGYVLPGLQSIDHQGPNFAVLAIKKGIPFGRWSVVFRGWLSHTDRKKCRWRLSAFPVRAFIDELPTLSHRTRQGWGNQKGWLPKAGPAPHLPVYHLANLVNPSHISPPTSRIMNNQ